MKHWKVVTETEGCTVRRTYEVISDTEPTDVQDMTGATLIDVDSDDYDMEAIESVEEAK